MRRIIKIEDWMSKSIIPVSKDSTVFEAVKLMDKHNIGGLPVMEGEAPIGIVTERDIIRRVLAPERDMHHMKVNEIMTRNPVTVDCNATVLEVARIMSENNFRRLLVTRKGKVAGIVTAKDLIGITST